MLGYLLFHNVNDRVVLEPGQVFEPQSMCTVAIDVEKQ